MRRSVYVSGPISHYDIEERTAAFKCVQEALEREGYLVRNPLENGLPREAPTRAHLRADLDLLLRCDCIYFMRGWASSAGCQLEYRVAQAIGCGMMFQDMEKEIDKGRFIYHFG